MSDYLVLAYSVKASVLEDMLNRSFDLNITSGQGWSLENTAIDVDYEDEPTMIQLEGPEAMVAARRIFDALGEDKSLRLLLTDSNVNELDSRPASKFG